MSGSAKTFHHPIWDPIWSRKVRQVLGGKVRLIGSGGAPATPENLKFIRAAMACEVVEGTDSTRCALIF
jgi:long-chain acyl-CoA synthetase